MDRKAKGKRGEDMAALFLMAKGIEIIEKNYQHGHGEIDLIGLRDNSTLIFFEVKFRKNEVFGHPEDFLSDNQSDKLVEVAETYIEGINWKGDVQFDIISINESNFELKHFEDVIS